MVKLGLVREIRVGIDQSGKVTTIGTTTTVIIVTNTKFGHVLLGAFPATTFAHIARRHHNQIRGIGLGSGVLGGGGRGRVLEAPGGKSLVFINWDTASHDELND